MFRCTVIWLSLALSIVTTVSLAWAAEPVGSWKFTDITGKLHQPFTDDSTRGIVLVFVSTDCPIANSYQPMLQRLAQRYAKDGIRFFMIHPNAQLNPDEALQHAQDFKIEVPVVIDKDLAVSTRVGATVTPEVFVMVRDQKKPVYQGRIDDRFAGYGRKRNVPTTNDLADALDAVVTGGEVKNTRTKAVGCFISYPK